MHDVGFKTIKQNQLLEEAKWLLHEVLDELDDASRKFPTWPVDPLHALAVLGEEYGKLNKSVLQMTYEPEKYKSSQYEIRREAIQVAAMAVRFLLSINEYRYQPCDQVVQANTYD